jgi:hypothetical protein
MDRVISNEMTKEEAYQRNNYYRFVVRCPGIDSPAKYVLETPIDELPPFTLEVYDTQAALEIWEGCAQMVDDGYISAYEAAEEYYMAVRA